MQLNPDEALRAIGAAVRAARIERGYSQQRLAKEAGVSRGQVVLLESGGNVSIKFLLRLAQHLDLTTISLGGKVQLTPGQSEGINVVELLQSLDLIGALVEHLRRVTLRASRPVSGRAPGGDIIALRDFVARHLDNPAGIERLANAIVELSDDVPGKAPTPAPVSERAEAARRARRGGRRKA